MTSGASRSPGYAPLRERAIPRANEADLRRNQPTLSHYLRSSSAGLLSAIGCPPARRTYDHYGTALTGHACPQLCAI